MENSWGLMGKYGILRDVVFANQLQTLAFETSA